MIKHLRANDFSKIGKRKKKKVMILRQKKRNPDVREEKAKDWVDLDVGRTRTYAPEGN